MNKKQVIEALKALGVTEAEMEGKDYNELRAMLKQKEAESNGKGDEADNEQQAGDATEAGNSPQAGRDSSVEEAKQGNNGADNASDAPEVADQEVSKDGVLDVSEIKLNVYEGKIIPLLPATKRVKIENLEGGDAYVDTTSITFAPSAKVAPGESKVFTGVTKLYVKSASRPILRLTQYSK